MAGETNSFPKGHLLKESIYHSFLPKKTPDRSQPDLDHIEQFILNSASQSFSRAIEESEFSELEGITKMMATWELLQPISNSPEEEDKFVENFVAQVTSLTTSTSASTTIPIYIRRQNSTLLIHREEDGTHLVVETFRAALPSKLVMSNVSPVVMQFPETSHVIQNMSLLASKSFAKSLYQMTVKQIDISSPMIMKNDDSSPDPREVPQPFLINHWVVAVLSPTSAEFDQTSEKFQQQIQPISKKIRDQVTLAKEKASRELLPFRRSGLWMTIKVAVQLKLIKIFHANEDDTMKKAKFVYKLLMLNYLADICKMYYDKRHYLDGGNDDDEYLDLTAQMLAKIGRRVYKLDRFFPPGNTDSKFEGGSTAYPNKVEILRQQILKRVEDIAKEFHQYMTRCQLKISGNDLGQTFYKLPPRSHLEYLGDLEHSIPFLSELPDHSESSKSDTSAMQNNTSEEMKESLELQRYPNLSLIMKGAKVLGEQYNLRERIWLYDTETFMKTQMMLERDTSKIRDLLQTYVRYALKLYSSGNPVGISQMILVTLKAVEILDRRASDDHPILKQHTSGINCESFDHLLLPHRDHITLLEDILNYFRGRNKDAIVKDEGILPGNDITQNSFSVRFASANEEMSGRRKDILEETEKKISKMRSEIEEAKKQCHGIQTKIEKLKKERRAESLTHSQFTIRNESLESELRNTREQFKLFERPLPDDEDLQKAVVFEVLIPEVLSHLRDSLAILKFGLLEEPTISKPDRYFSVEWMEYDNLIEYLPYDCKGSLKGRNTVITLGSPHFNAAKRHFTRTTPDILRHTDNVLIQDNGLACKYNYSFRDTSSSSGLHRLAFYFMSAGIEPLTDLEALCSFQIHSASNSEPYLSLQKYLQSITHSQNDVIADQGSCHLSLTFDEFISFGSLRAGHMIQLRNLYRAIASNLLSLEEEPVIALILQTIWQIGPKEERTGGGRGALEDFKDEGFSTALLDMLQRVVQANENNYSHPLILMTAVVITVRIMDLNENAYERCYGLLRNWRKLVKRWRVKLDDLMGEEGVKNLKELKTKLLLINIASALSFNVSRSIRWNKIMRGEEDITEWCHVISSLELRDAEDSLASRNMLSGFMQVVYNTGKNVALQLQLEVEVKGSPILSKGLRQFVTEKWSKAKGCGDPSMTSVFKTHPNLIRLNYKATDNVTFDFILGTFLVNGSRQGQLPGDITCNKLFKRFFRQNTHLRVWQESDMVYRTTQAFHGKDYEFRILPRKMSRDRDSFMDVVIKETATTDDWTGAVLTTTLTLIDPDKFSEIIAPSFVENYTHWYSDRESIVYLRKIPTHDSDYSLPHDYKLVKMAKSGSPKWQFYDENNHGHLLSIRSIGFGLVTKALERLSKSKDINLIMDEGTNLVTAHLPQYNLRLMVKGNGMLECAQYPAYHLVRKVKDCTLIGLRHGIQIKSKHKRVLIIPNGMISCRQGTEKQSQRYVEIGLGNLGQPSYFVYEFDEVLNRLVANKSKQAWLYLAALHAVTSQSFPDPYTGLTGTEMAVRILQSGFVWSSSPYDEDCLRILNFIKGLAPKRTYYGHDFLDDSAEDLKSKVGSIEMIKWPHGIPSMAAYDGFEIIVEKLIEDSRRLEVLYYVEKKTRSYNKRRTNKEDDRPTSDTLRLRSYFRHLGSYNQAVTLEQHYFRSSLLENNLKTGRDMPLRVYAKEPKGLKLEEVARVAATRLNTNSSSDSTSLTQKSFKKDSLLRYLFKEYEPPQNSSIELVTNIFSLDFKTSWFTHYEFVMRKDKTDNDKHLVTLILCAMAYRDAPMEQILNLHFISEFSDQINFPTPPEEFPADQTACSKKRTACVNPSDYAVESGFRNIILRNMDIDEVKMLKGISKNKIYREVKAISKIIRSDHLPCANIKETEEGKIKQLLTRQLPLNAEDVLDQINMLLHQWHWTAQLKMFVDEVQKNLNQIRYSLNISDGNCNDEDAVHTFYKYGGCKAVVTAAPVVWGTGIHLESILDTETQLDTELLEEAKEYFASGRIFPNQNGHGPASVPDMLKACVRKANDIVQSLCKMLVGAGSSTGRILWCTFICPRLDQTSLLRHVSNIPSGNEGSTIIYEYAGALGVLWSQIKRLKRCLAYEESGQLQELERELANEGFANWLPKKYPEWLLLQLELDLMIRPIQVTVAEQMMEMPDKKNGVMQLNMGEGKTSVIVPMLCSVLGDENRLCRVTVLSSMFNMNHRLLSFAIGGLLNRRVYTIPCKRDMEIDLNCVNAIQTAYGECLGMKGVVITQPEYRLSFRLLAYDKILRKEIPLGLKLLKTENWLRSHARDILDESDELFNVKYQLVYTVGKQLQLDGGKQRWVICQRLLQVVQEVKGEFRRKYGEAAIEIQGEELDSNSHQFTPIRLLDSNIHLQFADAVADRVLEKDIRVNLKDKETLKLFLTQQDLKEDDLEGALKIAKDDPELLNKVLILSGYLRRGILTLGLSKRWRVEYGVNVSNPYRQMAVPFRAKDVPAERAEFGHPDLAILLTHLSYYYSGLSETEFAEVLNVLKIQQGPDAIYQSWIDEMPEDQVGNGFETFRGLNLKDSQNRSGLFEMLKRHKLVIDFWLSNKVFPREAKQFKEKIVMTSWDLCYERGVHPVTGFSGTNDSSILLPLNIAQQDLQILEETNKEVEKYLLHPENTGHRKLEMGVDCKRILELMRVDSLTVLIDAGALMLDCDNEQVASMWLDMVTDAEIEAILYFSGNELLVKRRNGRRGRARSRNRDVLFELSSYQGRLDKCGVFLDDQHCRGTDLKFSLGSRACVTVGGNMKRDKLIQACMRMRKLGRGHCVTFYLSHEAYNKVIGVRNGGGDKVTMTTGDVLEWTRRNTDDFNKDGLLYWAIAGKNYAQRLAAEDNFYCPQSCHDWDELGWVKHELGSKVAILGNQCVDVEVTSLMHLYGQHSRVDLLVNVIERWFAMAIDTLKQKNGKSDIPVWILENFEKIRRLVVGRCWKYAPDKTHLSGVLTDEEQERELEVEKEAEIEKITETRRGIKAAKNILNVNVGKVILLGEPIGVMDGIMRLCDMFQCTSFWKEVQPNGWGKDVFATKDFIRVIDDINERTDTFLRPIEWVAASEDGERLLVISPFEMNALMQSGPRNFACPIRMFSLRRSERQDLMLNERRLIYPRGRANAEIISDEGKATAALLLASGNLYFKNMTEQRAFAEFLSLAPLPLSKMQNMLSKNGLISITRTGFILPRGKDESNDRFKNDPSKLVRKILEYRHPLLSDKAHVVRILDEKKYVELENK